MTTSPSTPLRGLPSDLLGRVSRSPLQSYFLPPTRLLWKSAQGVEGADLLLHKSRGQSVLAADSVCVLTSSGSEPAGILLDFGVEIQGSVEIFTPMTDSKGPFRVRVRFGESASEAMSELGGARNAQNDHALRDQVVELPWFGRQVTGQSGFRFVRIDSIGENQRVELAEVRAILVLRDLPAHGSFRCNDERLNRIWDVGAYTVQLNMQEYLWDGIKRDRLVWIGDMHPEVSTINAAFGFNEVVPKSLDLARDIYPPSTWMNTISSYSMWWVILHRDWWLHHGDRPYLKEQRTYLLELLANLAALIDDHGSEKLTGMRFLDWPTAANAPAIHEGLQALMVLTMQAGAELCRALEEPAHAQKCEEAMARLCRHRPGPGASKQSTALMKLAGLMEAPEALAIIQKNGAHEISTFYGYYVLEALATSGAADTALDFIRQFWGGMLDRGATTFWEDFNLDWLENSGRIDELTPVGKKDLHGDYGAHCYIGFRHSLCHGWASGPTAWMSRHVLGIQPVAAGFSQATLSPQLGNLQWAEGSYPTPHGPIHVRHERQPNGEIKTESIVPPQIQIV